MARPPAVLLAIPCLAVVASGVLPAFGPPDEDPDPIACWNSTSRMMIANDSQYAGQAGGACATLPSDICNHSSENDFGDPYCLVGFDNGYANRYRYADLAPCEDDPGSPGAGHYMLTQSLVIKALTNESHVVEAAVRAAVNTVLQGLVDDLSVSASETNESSPFGADTVPASNDAFADRASVYSRLAAFIPLDRLAIFSQVACGLWPPCLDYTLWLVDYQVAVPDFCSALQLATLMQDRELASEALYAGFSLATSDVPLTPPMWWPSIGPPFVLARPCLEAVVPTTTRTTTTVQQGGANQKMMEDEQVEGQQSKQKEQSAVQSEILTVAAASVLLPMCLLGVATTVVASRRRPGKLSDNSFDINPVIDMEVGKIDPIISI